MRRRLLPFGLENIFKSFSREFEKMEKEIKPAKRDYGVIDLSELAPEFKTKRPGVRGFTINISSRTGQKPHVNLQTFGDVERKKLEEQLAAQLGISQKEIKEVKMEDKQKAVKVEARPPKIFAAKPKTVPLVTEEPKARITQLPGRVVVELELPGVKEEDIEIRELTESVEVKATAEEKVFFKIITLPTELHAVSREFSNGVLRLEFGY